MLSPKANFSSIKLAISAIILLSGTYFAFSQNTSFSDCGTTISNERANYYKSLQPELKKIENNFYLKKTSKTFKTKNELSHIPVKAHIVRSESGSSTFDVNELNDAIDNLNRIYANALMHFYLYDGVNYIDSDILNHYKKGNENELLANNYTPNAINIYFIDFLENSAGESICGYTVEKLNVVAMKSSCATNSTTLAHEIGHIFSLVHTHGWSDNGSTTELVDGSNCDTDGDGICDTPADPGLSANNLDGNCNYIGNLTDANGDVYQPDTQNIMSYATKSCRAQFSDQQFARMYAYYTLIKEGFSSDHTDLYNTNVLTDIKVYPNPVSGGKIKFNLASFESTVNYSISNLQGQVLAVGTLSKTEIDVNNLPTGSYLLTLSDSQYHVVKKFIK